MSAARIAEGLWLRMINEQLGVELKLCPFCGHKPELVEANHDCYVIRCTNHDWPSECKDTDVAGYVNLCSWGIGSAAKEALIKAWNTRAEIADD